MLITVSHYLIGTTIALLKILIGEFMVGLPNGLITTLQNKKRNLLQLLKTHFIPFNTITKKTIEIVMMKPIKTIFLAMVI